MNVKGNVTVAIFYVTVLVMLQYLMFYPNPFGNEKPPQEQMVTQAGLTFALTDKWRPFADPRNGWWYSGDPDSPSALALKIRVVEMKEADPTPKDLFNSVIGWDCDYFHVQRFDSDAAPMTWSIFCANENYGFTAMVARLVGHSALVAYGTSSHLVAVRQTGRLRQNGESPYRTPDFSPASPLAVPFLNVQLAGQ